MSQLRAHSVSSGWSSGTLNEEEKGKRLEKGRDMRVGKEEDVMPRPVSDLRLTAI